MITYFINIDEDDDEYNVTNELDEFLRTHDEEVIIFDSIISRGRNRIVEGLQTKPKKGVWNDYQFKQGLRKVCGVTVKPNVKPM